MRACRLLRKKDNPRWVTDAVKNGQVKMTPAASKKERSRRR